MEESLPAAGHAPSTAAITRFLLTQVLLLAITPLAGGFRFRAWSLLDTALMLAAIGVTALVPILDDAKSRRTTTRFAVGLYLLAVVDMSVNVVVSGVVGWQF